MNDFQMCQRSRKSGTIHFSIAGLIKRLECDPVTCNQKCCKGHMPTSIPQFGAGEKISPEARQCVTMKTLRVNQDSQSNCLLIPICAESRLNAPTGCQLFPLTFNEKGLLILNRYAWLHCPGYGKGAPIYLSFASMLTRLLGKKAYTKLAKACTEAAQPVATEMREHSKRKRAKK